MADIVARDSVTALQGILAPGVGFYLPFRLLSPQLHTLAYLGDRVDWLCSLSNSNTLTADHWSGKFFNGSPQTGFQISPLPTRTINNSSKSSTTATLFLQALPRYRSSGPHSTNSMSLCSSCKHSLTTQGSRCQTHKALNDRTSLIFHDEIIEIRTHSATSYLLAHSCSQPISIRDDSNCWSSSSRSRHTRRGVFSPTSPMSKAQLNPPLSTGSGWTPHCRVWRSTTQTLPPATIAHTS